MEKYIICSLEDYQRLNAEISTYRGYPDSTESTDRYAPEQPILTAEIRDELNEVISPAMCVLPILPDLQDSNIIASFELVDRY